LGHDPRPLLARKHTAAVAARLILKRAHGVARYSEVSTPFAEHPDLLSLDLLVEDGQAAHVRVDDWTILGRTLVRGTDAQAAARLAEHIAQVIAARVELGPS
jgi:hypothetical protein